MFYTDITDRWKSTVKHQYRRYLSKSFQSCSVVQSSGCINTDMQHHLDFCDAEVQTHKFSCQTKTGGFFKRKICLCVLYLSAAQKDSIIPTWKMEAPITTWLSHST